MPRLFTGIELPLEQREELRRLRHPLPGAKWVDLENLHLTLRFAGDIDNTIAAEFADRLAGIAVDAFEMRLGGPWRVRRQRAALDLGGRGGRP